MGTERRRAAALLGLGCLTFALGCISFDVPVRPPTGAFSYYSAPLATHFHATPVGSKTGVAVVRHFEIPINGQRLPLASWADASTREAAAEGGIQTVYYADYELINVLGIYVQLTVRVSGD